LEREAERKTALIDRLNQAKSAWEASSQSRIDLLNQRIERLRADVAARDRQVAAAATAGDRLSEQAAQEQRSARQTLQSYTTALSASETEAARLQIELDASTVSQRRIGASIRLWQIAAIIGIANTLILLVIVVQWLRGG
jgi:chromosome segregation ATPase